MECSSCKKEVPAQAQHCPYCGTLTPYQISQYGMTPEDATFATPSQMPPPPATSYGGAFTYSSSPYEIPNPYKAPIDTRITPQQHRTGSDPYLTRETRVGIVVLVALLILLGSAGTVAGVLLTHRTSVSSSSAILLTPSSSVSSSISTSTTSPASAGTDKIPYPPYQGMLVVSDTLQANSSSNWQVTSDTNGSCAFTGGAYHANVVAGYFYSCPAFNGDFANFVYEAQMKIVKGDCGALLFRVDKSVTMFYYFRICQDGTYAIFRYDGGSSAAPNLIPSHLNTAISAGLNQSNVVAVVAQKSSFDLYVNHSKIDNFSDPTYSHGGVVVVADGVNNHATEVVYTNAKVWEI